LKFSRVAAALFVCALAVSGCVAVDTPAPGGLAGAAPSPTDTPVIVIVTPPPTESPAAPTDTPAPTPTAGTGGMSGPKNQIVPEASDSTGATPTPLPTPRSILTGTL